MAYPDGSFSRISTGETFIPRVAGYTAAFTALLIALAYAGVTIQGI